MKIYEILSINRELLERLNSFGINTNDFKDVEIYSEYLKMKSLGYKDSEDDSMEDGYRRMRDSRGRYM